MKLLFWFLYYNRYTLCYGKDLKIEVYKFHIAIIGYISLIGYVAQVEINWSTKLYSIIYLSHCKSFEDWVPVIWYQVQGSSWVWVTF